MAQPKTRKKIVDALMALAAERRWEDVTLEALAERAEVPLATLRDSFDSRGAVLAEFVRGVDEEVLSRIDPALAEEAPRERLFDVLFSRFEILAPHTQAIRNLARAALRDPLLALELNRLTTLSMAWMLTAAGIPSTGGRGLLRAQALALVWVRVMRAWLDDDDPGHARTMAALDKRLREAESAAVQFDRLTGIVSRVRRARPRRRGSEPREEGDIAEGHPS
ncbi:MAG: TetR/AcrR family transcriptional regulator [Propylenella sp.]